MKKNLLKKPVFALICFLFIASNSTNAQSQKLIDKIQKLQKKVFVDPGLLSLDTKDVKQYQLIDSLLDNLRYFRKFETEENKFNGKVKFDFDGNESDLNQIFDIRTGIEFDRGTFPYELDVNLDFQTLVKNGEIQERISNMDISFDYTPFFNNGFALETFTFLNRFKDTYLSIDQRYETGSGIIFNWHGGRLTKKGNDVKEKISKMREFKRDSKLITCYDGLCKPLKDSEKLDLLFTDANIKEINKIKSNHINANRKKYSLFRIAVLTGIYYELETAKLERMTMFEGKDTSFVKEFETTNKLRYEIRPTLEVIPSDIVNFKFDLYWKLPLTNRLDIVNYDNDNKSEIVDKMLDFQSKATVKITKSLFFTVEYRYIHDYAPKRAWFLDSDNIPVLIEGQKTHNFYRVGFTYSL